MLLFGAFQDLAGWGERCIDAPTVGAVKRAIAAEAPALAKPLDRNATLVILNRALLARGPGRDDHSLVESDELAFGPPVSGG